MDADEPLKVTIADGSESAELREILADPHVRYLLRFLRDESGAVSLPTAATHVAAGVTDTAPAAVPTDVSNRVQTFLHRGQLPTLASHGVVEFDRERNTVSLNR